MNLFYSVFLLLSITISGIAKAGCTMKCISRDPFSGNCLIKTQVCDVGSPSDWINQVKKEGEKAKKGITNLWHDVYGVLPENVRVVLNNHVFTAIGAYYGGLEGAALGYAIDELLQKTGLRLQRLKDYSQGQPEWKVTIMENGTNLVTLKHESIITLGQADRQFYKEQIDHHYNNFLVCVQNASEVNAGWDCYDSLEDELIRLERKSRRE